MKSLFRFSDSLIIAWVDDEDHSVILLEVVNPQISYFLLATDIPDGEVERFVLDFLDIESDSRDWVDYLSELHFIENSSFSGSIESEHEKSFGRAVCERINFIEDLIDNNSHS